MSNVAYNKKDIKKISQCGKKYAKFIRYRLYSHRISSNVDRVLRKIKLIVKTFFPFLNIEKFTNTDKCIKKRILIYPAIDNKQFLAEILNKVAWGFPFKKNIEIFVTVTPQLMDTNILNLVPDTNQRKYLQDAAKFQLVLKKEAAKYFDSDLLLLHDTKELWKFILTLKIHKVEIIDKNYYSLVESDIWRSKYFSLLTNDEIVYFENLSKKNYRALLTKNKNKTKACCYNSGPTFSLYKCFNLKQDVLNVICNSMVKNSEFLEDIGGPDILTFADPVFHFSPCEYAAKFRDYVMDVTSKYGCFIIVPEKTVPLLLAHYPGLENKIIGMKMFSCDEFNFPTVETFWVKGSSNILTLFMLNIASSISKKIYIIGADGREKKENYFWKHNSSVQFDDLMDTVFETHPSFFRDRIYEDYYEEHCEFLEEQLKYGENRGKMYYSLTQSFIPALKKRYIKELNESEFKEITSNKLIH